VKKYVLPAEPFHLSKGSHNSPENGACFNELAAILAGKTFNDAPKCVSPVIRRLGMTLNDRLDDDRRQLLRPFVLRSLGTAGDGRDEERRQLCTEWLLHHALPTLLEKADRKTAADKLRALPGDLAVEGVRRALHDAREEAWSARRAAVDRLAKRIRKAMPAGVVAPVGAVAVDVADAVATVAVAAADVADAAAATAGVVAAADATVVAAVVVAVATVVVDAAVAAAVAATADAAVVADVADAVATVVVASPSARRNAIWNAVYDKMRERFASKPLAPELLDSALKLMDQMLPESPIHPPVIEHAEIICAAP